MPYTFEELLRENEGLKERVMKLEHQLENALGRLRDLGEEREEEEPKYLIRRGRRKGTGAHYDVIKLNRQHRQVLYTLLSQGAISPETAIPAAQIRRLFRISQGALSGRVSELIKKDFVKSNQVRVLFQPDSEGSMRWRPESAYDPNIRAWRYKRFCYYVTEAGKRKLIETALPSDDFLKAMPSLEVLAELKARLEEKAQGIG